MKNNVSKIALLLIAAVMLVSIAFAGAGSAGTYSGGSGTADDPYQISTAFDLYNLSMQFDWKDKTVYYKLMNDISISNITSIVRNDDTQTITIESSSADPMVYNYSSYTFSQSNWNPGFDASVAAEHPDLSSWIPIGSQAVKNISVNIIFDGNGKVLSGLFINQTSGDAGLFEKMNPKGGDDAGSLTLTNLTLKNSFVVSTDSVGGLLASMPAEDTCDKQTVIANCTVMDSAICSRGSGEAKGVGGMVGFVGYSRDLDMKNCTVLNSTVAGKSCIGGLIGHVNNELKNVRGCLEKCKVEHCTIVSPDSGDGHSNVGGLIGYIVGSYFPIKTSTILSSTIIASNSHVGGVVGSSNNLMTPITDCHVMKSTIVAMKKESGGQYSGGIIGVASFGIEGETAGIENCTVSDSSVTGLSKIGGLAGSLGSRSLINNNSVTNCIIKVLADGVASSYVGGLAGETEKSSILNCTVANCSEISGAGYVGGLSGFLEGEDYNKIENNLVVNSTIIGRQIISDEKSIGGFTGKTRADPECPPGIVNTTLKDLDIIVVSGEAEYAYLFDSNLYKIHSSNGIARLKQINLSNNNTIINSRVLNLSQGENTMLEGFSDFSNNDEFSIDVSNAGVTSIPDNAFKNKKLTALFNISSVTSFGEGSLGTASLTGGFYFPKSVNFNPAALAGANNLQLIYGSSIEDLPKASARINITDEGTLPNVKPGSFSSAQSNGNTFEMVKLGNNYANRFKNLSSGEYLNATDSWTAGNAYLAVWNGTVISLDATGGRGGSSFVNATCENSTLPVFTNPTRSGYTFLGWFNESTGGEQIINTTGSLIAGVAGYTDADGNWINEEKTITLYAQWQQNSQPYTPSHKESGSTVILKEGQVAPTVTPTPTPTPTVKPIETPAGNSTIKPTTVPTKPSTSKSPAPLAGILAGLGAAALFLRLRK